MERIQITPNANIENRFHSKTFEASSTFFTLSIKRTNNSQYSYVTQLTFSKMFSGVRKVLMKKLEKNDRAQLQNSVD